MTAETPRRNAKTRIEARVLDDIIERIDDVLPHLHARAANGHAPSKSPTRGLSRVKFKRSQSMFQDMRDDPLLNDTGDDIRLEPEEIIKVTPKHRSAKSGRLDT